MTRIAISYRRSDTGGEAQRLCQALRRRYGNAAVFVDLERIAPAARWRAVVEDAFAQADVVIVLIGPRWVSESGAHGTRLHEDGDVVRHEVALALRRGVAVPVFVEDARPPAAADLPEDLRDLPAIQGVELRNRSWGDDLRRLGCAIDDVLSGRRSWMVRAWRLLVPRSAVWEPDRLRRRRQSALAAALAAGLLAVAADLAGVTDPLEARSVDSRFSLRGTEPVHRLAVVGIDDRTLARFPHHHWPFPRTWTARVVRRLHRAGARLVVLDIDFRGRTRDREDLALLEAIKGARGAVVAVTASDAEGNVDVLGGSQVLRYFHAIPGSTLIWPDSVVRRMPYALGPTRNIAFVAAAQAGSPVDPGDLEGGAMWIDYHGPAGTVPQQSYVDVLRGRFHSGTVRGRVVVVGATTPDLQDVHSTPYGGRLMSGPEIVADAIDTAMRDAPLRSAPSGVGVGVTLLLVALIGLAALRASATGVLVLTGALAVIYAVAAQVAFDHGTIVPVVAPLLGTLMAGLVAAGLRSGASDRASAPSGARAPARAGEVST